MLLVPGLHEHHLFVFVPRCVGSVGAGDAPRSRGGWLDTPACPTAPATVLHNGGGTLLRPFAAALGSPQTLTTWSRPSLCRTTAFYIIRPLFSPFSSFSLFPPSTFSIFFPPFVSPSTPVRLVPDSYGISARSVSARWTTPLLKGETPAIRTREHRNNVQTTVTQCILSFSFAVAASPSPSSSSSSASTSFPPLDDSASLLQEEHLKSFLVRGYSRTYRSSLLSGQGASLLLSYEK